MVRVEVGFGRRFLVYAQPYHEDNNMEENSGAHDFDRHGTPSSQVSARRIADRERSRRRGVRYLFQRPLNWLSA